MMLRNTAVIAAMAGGLALISAAAGHASTSSSAANPPALANYPLGVGDHLRITTFDEPTLSGEFTVNADGAISFPLIGDVPATGRTTEQLSKAMTRRLAAGYLKAPRISIDVIGYRPFYVLGEVNQPGQYPYSPGLTVTRAVATANGFTYRADRRHALLKHEHQPAPMRVTLTGGVPVRPGDVIQIKERYF
jgi:polysaccharide export outer membrane protein